MISVSVEPDAGIQEVETVKQGLLEYNVRVIGEPHEEPVQVFLRDGDHIVGGLLGHLKWKWLYVSKLWISEQHRGKGHGYSLMTAAESFARSKGCIGSYLDTFEYQARPFYEKCGYELFGTLDGYPPGSRQFFLFRRL
jgi:GNAT superfamily N-acetyltransferase